MANKERKTSESQEGVPERLGHLSMEGLDVEEALKGAMEVTLPERDTEPDEDDGDEDGGDNAAND